MSLEAGIYKLVYEYYESRILYGFYTYGENLPSISKICAIFHMAPATVRTGLAALEKQGYIQIDARKASKVIYKSDHLKRKKSAAKYFVPREKEIRDILDSIKFLLEPCREAGMNQWSSEEWEKLRDSLDRAPEDMISMPVQFYLSALNTLDNSLILNLYWEVIRFIRFPYLMENKECDFDQAAEKLFQLIKESQKNFAIESKERIPFHWNIYHQRPQLCYSLVCSVIRDIKRERYPIGSFLPSLPQMAGNYDVSISTVRRALNILNSVGITRSFQGKGTQIKMNVSNVDFNRPEIRDGLRLYLEALQLLKLTIRKVLLFTLLSVLEDERLIFIQNFLELLGHKKSHFCFDICLTLIKEKCPLSTVRECYSKVQELIAWGYPFTIYRLKDKEAHAEYFGGMQKAAGYLKKEDFPGFSGCFEDLYEKEERNVRNAFKI